MIYIYILDRQQNTRLTEALLFVIPFLSILDRNNCLDIKEVVHLHVNRYNVPKSKFRLDKGRSDRLTEISLEISGIFNFPVERMSDA